MTFVTMKNFNRQIDYLCFTANTAGSTIALNKQGSPTAVTLETSTDGSIWTTYTFGSTITLSNIWDKVYWRNTSTTDTLFSLDNVSNYYQFVITWSIAASWDVTTLINKNWTDTLPDYCFVRLFYNCRYLTTPPQLLATNLGVRCYNTMFYQCFELIALPKMSALLYPNYACAAMFNWCSKIKLSTTQTWVYQTPYRIPDTWTWSIGTSSFINMFLNTWWTFTWAPTINTTYYTSNTLV